jgi:hypothetical protein
MDECGNCTLKGNLAGCKEAPCSRRETWYAKEQQKRIDGLEEALRHAQSDINWMINARKFLNGFVFDYIDEALK